MTLIMDSVMLVLKKYDKTFTTQPTYPLAGDPEKKSFQLNYETDRLRRRLNGIEPQEFKADTPFPEDSLKSGSEASNNLASRSQQYSWQSKAATPEKTED
jgi:hypothetical protein